MYILLNMVLLYALIAKLNLLQVIWTYVGHIRCIPLCYLLMLLLFLLLFPQSISLFTEILQDRNLNNAGMFRDLMKLRLLELLLLLLLIELLHHHSPFFFFSVFFYFSTNFLSKFKWERLKKISKVLIF